MPPKVARCREHEPGLTIVKNSQLARREAVHHAFCMMKKFPVLFNCMILLNIFTDISLAQHLQYP